MIDGAGLLRQITTEADMGSFMRHPTALDPAQIEAGFELSYTTTQTFDDSDQPVERDRVDLQRAADCRVNRLRRQVPAAVTADSALPCSCIPAMRATTRPSSPEKQSSENLGTNGIGCSNREFVSL